MNITLSEVAVENTDEYFFDFSNIDGEPELTFNEERVVIVFFNKKFRKVKSDIGENDQQDNRYYWKYAQLINEKITEIEARYKKETPC